MLKRELAGMRMLVLFGTLVTETRSEGRGEIFEHSTRIFL